MCPCDAAAGGDTSREAQEEPGARGWRSEGSPPGLVGEEEEVADPLDEKGLEPRIGEQARRG